MVKKFASFVSVFLALIFCICSAVLTYAATDINASNVDIYAEETQNICITDQDALEKIVQMKNLQIPEGYHLECYEQSLYVGNEYVSADNHNSFAPEPRAFVYRIENVVVRTPDFYYVHEYQHDIYQGPATISTIFTQSKAVKKSIGVSIGNSTVKAAVGYDITDTYTISKEFSATVSAGKYLDIRVYPLYRRTTFDIYNQWTGEFVQRNARTDQPVGLYIEQYTYSQ